MDAQFTATAAESERPAGVVATLKGTRSKAVLAVILVLLGLGGLAQQLADLWALWTNDALRSFGMLLPLAAICLGAMQFKSGNWNDQGSWWGFAAMAAAVTLAINSATHTPYLNFLFGGHMLPLHLLPVGALLWLYFAGAVVLFGGHPALRRQRFPLILLLFVNPVPHAFTTLADLPLQAIGAQTARAFAQWLAVPVNGDELKLMFSPQLGMFVAPGCDGLRGAVALGYLALIVGYLKRMRPVPWTLFVVGAVLLAYVFNLLRLCGVILYYWLALRVPVISGSGAEVDYAIGGVLFFCAALFLFGIPRLLQPQVRS